MYRLNKFFAFSFVVLNCMNAVHSQESKVSPEMFGKAVEHLKRVESIETFRMHGSISLDKESYEVWMERRGDKYWFSRKRIPKDKLEAEAFAKRVEIVSRELNEQFMFDGKHMSEYKPSILNLRIERMESFKIPTGFGSMMPQSWLHFGFSPQKPKTTFRAMLTELLQECTVEKTNEQQMVRITRTYDSKEVGKKIGHASRHLIVDPATGFIVSTNSSGGFALSVESQLSWKESGAVIYVNKCKIVVGENRVTEWSIDEFTDDTSKVRSDFSIDWQSLPVGTKIEIDPQDKFHERETIYVGEGEGERQHYSKLEEMRAFANSQQHNQSP